MPHRRGWPDGFECLGCENDESMMPQLVLVSDLGDGETFELEGPSISLGTEAEADLCVAWREPGVVAPLHARLEERDGQWALINEAESLGTFLNGRKIGRRHVLRDGDEIELGLGGPRFRFQLMESLHDQVPTTVPVPESGAATGHRESPRSSTGPAADATGGLGQAILRLVPFGLLAALVLLAAYVVLFRPRTSPPQIYQGPTLRTPSRPTAAGRATHTAPDSTPPAPLPRETTERMLPRAGSAPGTVVGRHSRSESQANDSSARDTTPSGGRR